MARNKSEKHPFGHLPPKYVERLRLYALWKRAEHDVYVRTGVEVKKNWHDAKAAYLAFRDAFSQSERMAYKVFQDTEDFPRLREYWRVHYAP